jgi:hypothetical protein
MQPLRILAPVFFGSLLLLGLSAAAQDDEEGGKTAQAIPKALQGQIITSTQDIQVPTSPEGFIKNLKKQDKHEIPANGDGNWVVHFVAFFNQPLPQEQMGIVVLNPKNEPIAVADVSGQKGQTSLASQITIATTEYKGKAHTLQVYYPKGKQPKLLAKKQIVLK